MPPKSSNAFSQQTDRKGRPKTPKKPPPSLPEQIRKLFGSLCAQIDGGHFPNAVKTCDKILRLDPNDLDAQKSKLFLLLQTEQYSQALELIDRPNTTKDNALIFEKAYALYRLQRESEARDELKSISDDRAAMHLEAQISYREGEYQNAFDLYNQLLDTAEPQSEEHSDILTNLNAAQQHLDFINSGFHTAVNSLPKSIASSLEDSPPPIIPSANSSSLMAAAAAASSTAGPSISEKKSEKSPRQSRLPTGVVLGVTPPPDPERWLKKSERSSFMVQQSKKGRKGGGGGATQGAAVDVNAPSGGGSSGGGGKKGKKRK